MPKNVKYEESLSKEQIDFIKHNAVAEITSGQLADMFNDKFGMSFNKDTMKRIRRRLVPDFTADFSIYGRKNGQMSKLENRLNQEQKDFIKIHGTPNIFSNELAKIFNNKFGTSFSARAIWIMRCRLCPDLKFDNGEKSRQRAAKRGSFEREDRGYIFVRTSPGKFVGKHRVVWEEHYGPLPSGCIVTFIDGDKRNFDINNLIAVQKEIHVFMNKKKFPSLLLKDKDSLKALLAIQQICRKTCEKRRQREKPFCKPIGRPGFAY